MLVCTRDAHDVFHGEFPCRKRVRHKRSVTAPGHRFSAHQDAGLSFGKLNRTRERGFEFARLHVIREAAKTCVVPADIFGIGFRAAQPTKRLKVYVSDSVGSQRRPQSFAVILGVVARTRYGADVDYAVNPMRSQQLDQLAERTRRMADGENCLFLMLFMRTHTSSINHTARAWAGRRLSPGFCFSGDA